MRPNVFPSCRITGIFAALLLAGCAGIGDPNSTATPGLLDKLLAKSPPESAAPAPEKEGCGTASHCKSVLKKMVDDPKRGWVGQQQPPVAYTDGTRLFAYRALRTKLSCRELTLALGEVRAASKSLTGTVPGVTPNQATRTRALNTQVEVELSRERAARCRG